MYFHPRTLLFLLLVGEICPPARLCTPATAAPSRPAPLSAAACKTRAQQCIQVGISCACEAQEDQPSETRMGLQQQIQWMPAGSPPGTGCSSRAV